MALIKCNECEKEISDKASVCPNCGCPQLEQNYEQNNLNTEINKKIENNIESVLTWGDTCLVLFILIAIINFIICTSLNQVVLAFIGTICCIIAAFLTSVIIKWFGYTLKCLYDIKFAIKDKNNIYETESDEINENIESKIEEEINQEINNDNIRQRNKDLIQKLKQVDLFAIISFLLSIISIAINWKIAFISVLLSIIAIIRTNKKEIKDGKELAIYGIIISSIAIIINVFFSII